MNIETITLADGDGAVTTVRLTKLDGGELRFGLEISQPAKQWVRIEVSGRALKLIGEASRLVRETFQR